MSQFSCQTLLDTSIASLRDVVCDGSCRGKSGEECARRTSLVYPYRGVFMRHVGKADTVAESNQVIFFNRGEDYRVSHPVEGGDVCLDVQVDEAVLSELAPKEQLRPARLPGSRDRAGASIHGRRRWSPCCATAFIVGSQNHSKPRP